MIFLFLLFINLISAEFLEEICIDKKAFIHHNFKTPECPLPPPDPRRWGDPYVWCDNQGTWAEERFKCYFPNSLSEGGYCKYGYSDHSKTCIPRVLQTEDIWILPNENTGNDWEWNVLDLEIKGNEGDIWFKGELYEDVYNYTEEGFKTHLAITLDYNDTCLSEVKLYVNGTLAIEVNEEIDYYFLIFLRAMIEIEEESENNEKIYFAAAWDCLLDDEQIQYLYTLGSDRFPNTTLSCCAIHDLTDSFVSQIPHSWKVWFYVLVIPLIVFVIIIVILLFYVFFRYFRNQSKRYVPLNEEEEMDTSGSARIKEQFQWGKPIPNVLIVVIGLSTIIVCTVVLVGAVLGFVFLERSFGGGQG